MQCFQPVMASRFRGSHRLAFCLEKITNNFLRTPPGKGKGAFRVKESNPDKNHPKNKEEKAMAMIELDRGKMKILREILANHLSEVRMEIANTDDKEFRGFLRERIEFLEQFIQVLEKESAAAGREVANKPLMVDFSR